MPTDSGTNDILSLGFLHYTTAVSREMSDEPLFIQYVYCTAQKIRFFYVESDHFRKVHLYT